MGERMWPPESPAHQQMQQFTLVEVQAGVPWPPKTAPSGGRDGAA